MDDDVRLFHEIRHVAKEFHVSLEVSLFHVTRISKHSCKHTILIDCAILYTPFTLPDDLLLLFKTFVQKIYLKWKAVLIHVIVEIREINVIHNRFIVHGQTKLFCQSLGKGAFAL